MIIESRKLRSDFTLRINSRSKCEFQISNSIDDMEYMILNSRVINHIVPKIYNLRGLGYTPIRRRTNFHHLEKSLKLNDIKDLPVKNVVTLPATDYKPSKGHEINEKLPRIVLLHGLFGSKQNYRSVGKEISEKSHHRTTGLDLRNHGDAEWAAPQNYSALANDVISYLDSHKLRDVILVGHSMGAKAAMVVSLLRPDLLSKLVIIDNSPVSHVLDSGFTEGLIGMCKVERKMADSSLSTKEKTKKIDEILAEYEKDPLVRIFYMSNLVKKPKNGRLFRVPVLNFLKEDALSNLGDWPTEIVKDKKFDKPVLVLKAKHSNFINEETINEFNNYFSQFELQEVDSGHWIVSEKPSTFVDLMLKFIDK